jgi:hypothetical protein
MQRHPAPRHRTDRPARPRGEFGRGHHHNEGPTVIAGHAELSLIPRAVLNYVVPFCVSCYSAAAAE